MRRLSAKPARSKKRRGVKAWLITWEWVSDHAKRDEKVAAILNPRPSTSRVRELVEFLHLNARGVYSLKERLAFALRKSRTLYRATCSRGVIHCGHHPFLLARLVDDLVIQRDEEGKETATWKNHPLAHN
jgi:hypothetical protein